MRIILLMVLLVLITSCSDKKNGEVKIMDDSLRKDIKDIENVKLYFGHQSVGFNIIDGIEDILKKLPDANINIVDIDKDRELSENYIAHSQVGKNTQPNSKCDAFSKKLNEDLLSQTEIALLKFCYVDIRYPSNVEEVFSYYISTIDSIKKKYPNLTLVHSTIPLKKKKMNWKILIKNIIGREVEEDVENFKRSKYNDLLRSTFKNEPIFDIAKVESTYPNNKRESHEKDGYTYYSMISDYTYDSGHLNETGRQLAAKELIKIIAQVNRDFKKNNN